MSQAEAYLSGVQTCSHICCATRRVVVTRPDRLPIALSERCQRLSADDTSEDSEDLIVGHPLGQRPSPYQPQLVAASA